MALSLLAGPFDIVDGEGEKPINFYVLEWWPGVGMLAGIYGSMGVLTLDGVFQSASQYVSFDYGLAWWSDAGKMMMRMGGDFHEYVLDPKTFVKVGMVPEDEIVGVARDYVRIGRTRFRTVYAAMISVTDGVETILAPLPVGISAVKGPGRNVHELFLIGYDHDVHMVCCCFFDISTSTFTPLMYPGIGDDTTILYFAPEFGVVITYDDYVLRVWSTEVKPFSVSVPELYKGESRGGRLATYRVRVTGDIGEACVGELIDWTHSGEGSLLKYQSETDEDGYAITRVRYGLSDSGSVEIKASLTC